MNRHIGHALLALAAAAVLLAIWTPVGDWWQWTLTALFATITAAAILGDNP